MRPSLLLAAALLSLLTVPTSPYHSPPLHPHHDTPERSFPISSKALFTLGALAVLGGASFYLGKHTGFHAAQKGGHMHGGAGYPMAGYQFNPYNHYNQYEVDPYLPHQGFAAGIYAQPILAYQGRRRRRRGVEGADEPAVAASSSSPPVTSPPLLSPSPLATSPSSPATSSSPLATSASLQKLQYNLPASNLVPGHGVRGQKQLVDPRNAGSSKTTPAVEPSKLAGGWKLPDSLLPPIDLYGLTHNKKFDAIQAEKATKIMFPDDPKLVNRERRSTTSRKDIVVTSGLLHVADDPFSDYKTYRVPAKDHHYRDYKPVRFPSTSSEVHASTPDFGRRGSSTESTTTDDRDFNRITTVPGTDPRTRYGSSVYPFEVEQRQSLECREAVEARNFEQFGLLMLESAMMEDRDGCGLSLVCEVGRVPLDRLPPKALGLRKLLTGRKPRGLDGDLWGTLTQSLLTGLSQGDCDSRYPVCSAPPQQLLRVFSEL